MLPPTSFIFFTFPSALLSFFSDSSLLQRTDGEEELREARMMRSLAAATRLSQRIREAETRMAAEGAVEGQQVHPQLPDNPSVILLPRVPFFHPHS